MPKCGVVACNPPREATHIGKGPCSWFYCCEKCKDLFVKGPPSFTPIGKTKAEKEAEELW